MDLISCCVSAPGKVILHGEHSVVYGKTAIAASLGIRTVAVIKEIEDQRQILKVTLSDLQLQDLIFDFEDIKTIVKTGTWMTPNLIDHDNYVSSVNTYLQDYIKRENIELASNQVQAISIVLYAYCGIVDWNNFEFKPIYIRVTSDLTIGSGIGSSASYAVALAGVMFHYMRMKNPTYYQAILKPQNIDTPFDLCNFNEVEKKLISDWALNCEKISHGNPSGIDNAVCTYGSLIEFKKGAELTRHIPNINLRICLINTNVSRNTKSLVDKVAVLRNNHPNAVNSILDACDHVAKEALNLILNQHGNLTEYEKLSELYELNHNLLRTLGVSHPSLEMALGISRKFGFSCKLTGAGGGGYAISLLSPLAETERIDKLINALRTSGFGALIAQLGGEGVRVEIK